jgi:CheY-like chemotaxis protein
MSKSGAKSKESPMPAIESPVAPTTPAAASEYSPQARPAVRGSQTNNRARILSVSPTSEDHAALRHILDESPWQVTAASTCQEAISHLRQTRVSVILCAHVLGDGTWRDILHHIDNAADSPLLIVTARLADEYLWSEVLNLGGYDVLAKPFREREVRHVLTSAWVHKVDPVGHARAAGVA